MARDRKRLSQSALAELLGVTQPTISNWESGSAAPPIKIWKVVAKAYGVTVDVLLAHFAGVPQKPAKAARKRRAA